MSRLRSSLSAFALCVTIGACADLRYIEADFDGLYQNVFPKGIPDRHLKVLLLHGFGEHCIGYAEENINLLASELGWKVQTNSLTGEAPELWDRVQNNCISRSDDFQSTDVFGLQTRLCRALSNCKVITSRKLKSFTGGEGPFEYGYLRIKGFENESVPRAKITFYELTWDPTTRKPEFAFLGYDWAVDLHKRRAYFNREIKKNIVNLGFGDPVLYLGEYKPFIQVPIFAALCAMVMVDNNGSQPCDLNKLPRHPWQILELLEDTEFVIISESLGSYFARDAMVRIGRLRRLDQIPGDDEVYATALEAVEERQNHFIFEEMGFTKEGDLLLADATKEEVKSAERKVELELQRAETVAAFFYLRTRKVFMLANQIPLLRLSQIREPSAIIAEECILSERLTGSAPIEDRSLDHAVKL